MVGIQEAFFKHKKVLIRVDFNLPITEQGIVTDDRRMKATLPTIQKVIADGGIAILLSHFGRPSHGYEARYSLSRLLPLLSNLLQQPVAFAPNCTGSAVQGLIDGLAPGSVLLLENVRFHREETVGDTDFAQALAALADVYINDAFGTIHRNHTSIALLPTYFKERYAGYLLEQEVAATDKLFAKQHAPVVAIMGGNKLIDKAKPIQGLIGYVDHILIGGGLIWPLYQAKQATELAHAPEPAVAIASELLTKLTQHNHAGLWLPRDVVTLPEMDKQAKPSTLSLTDVPYGAYMVDIGPAAQADFSKVIVTAKAILWAGPLGLFEWDSCVSGTRAIAQAIAKATDRGAYSIVGGGHTAAAVKQLGYEKHVSYISTGGSALLAYIAANRKLLSLEALKR